VVDDPLHRLVITLKLRHACPEGLVAVLVLGIRAARAIGHALTLKDHVGLEAVLGAAATLQRDGAEQAGIHARTSNDRARLFDRALGAWRRQGAHVKPRRLFVVWQVAATLTE